MIKRFIPLLFLLGALTGLFGQQAAYVLGPAIVQPIAAGQPAQPQMQGMMTGADCGQMMMAPGQPGHHGGGKLCKDMSLACIAAMGCTIPIVLGDDLAPTMTEALLSPVVFWPAVPRLAGWSDAPEPEPPAHLI